MPRTKLDQDTRIPMLIKMYAVQRCMNLTRIAHLSGMGEKTIYNRMKNPDDFKRGELVAIKKTLRIPDEEMRSAVI